MRPTHAVFRDLGQLIDHPYTKAPNVAKHNQDRVIARKPRPESGNTKKVFLSMVMLP